jgi:spermidine synthase
VRWNRGVLGALAGNPLDDPRVQLVEADVVQRLGERQSWDAIVLDVDNGPAALTAAGNRRLYDRRGLEAIHRSLRPTGALAVWSATDDPRFSKALRSAGFDMLRHHVRARPNAGATHVLSIATKVAVNVAARPAKPATRRAQGPTQSRERRRR